MRHRLLSTSILVTLSITLLFLGIRPAFLKIDQHPKPRPRAVVESKVKSAEEEIGKKQLDIAAVAVLSEPVAVAALGIEPTVFIEKAVPSHSRRTVFDGNSRASPQLSA